MKATEIKYKIEERNPNDFWIIKTFYFLGFSIWYEEIGEDVKNGFCYYDAAKYKIKQLKKKLKGKLY